MFNLNENILNWKQNFNGNESFTKENIDELESHLIEQIADLKEAGLNDEEAFWVAQKRLGSVPSLNVEYSKINNLYILKKQIYWMLTGIAGLVMYVLAVTSLYYIFISIFMLLNLNPVSFILINNSFNEIVVICISVLVFWILRSKNSKLVDKYYFKNLDKFKRQPFVYLIILTFIISCAVYFYFNYRLNTDINRWIVNSESYKEFKDVNQLLNPLQFVLNSAIVLFVYYISFKSKKKLDILSNKY
jgi:hypothetical protein